MHTFGQTRASFVISTITLKGLETRDLAPNKVTFDVLFPYDEPGQFQLHVNEVEGGTITMSSLGLIYAALDPTVLDYEATPGAPGYFSGLFEILDDCVSLTIEQKPDSTLVAFVLSIGSLKYEKLHNRSHSLSHYFE